MDSGPAPDGASRNDDSSFDMTANSVWCIHRYGAGTVIGFLLSTMCTVNSFSVLSPTTL
jgi:hypothetical protein